MIAERQHQPLIAEEAEPPTDLHARERIVLMDAVFTAQRNAGRGLEDGIPVQAGIAGKEGFAGPRHAGNTYHETLLRALPEVMRRKDSNIVPLLLNTNIGDSELPGLHPLQPVCGIAAVRFARIAFGVGVSRKFLNVGGHRIGQLLDRERVVSLLPLEDVHATVAGRKQVLIADQADTAAAYLRARNAIAVGHRMKRIESGTDVGFGPLHEQMMRTIGAIDLDTQHRSHADGEQSQYGHSETSQAEAERREHDRCAEHREDYRPRPPRCRLAHQEIKEYQAEHAESDVRRQHRAYRPTQ